MNDVSLSESIERRSPTRWRGRFRVPPWAISVVFHAVVAVLLGLLIRPDSTRAVGNSDRAETMILSNDSSDVPIPFDDEVNDDEMIDGEQEDGDEEAEAESSSVADRLANASAAAGAPPSDDETPLSADTGLPKAKQVGVGRDLSGLVGDSQNATTGAKPRRTIDGKAITGIFGVEDSGHKFVYVFDRSASMSEPDGVPMKIAKGQLLGSIESLDRVHSFHIIFFNHNAPYHFNPTGQEGRLAFATPENKKAVRDWLRSMTASGGTQYLDALLQAVDRRPDVIFFLTDGVTDQAVLNFALVESVSKRNRRGGAHIHVIEFGAGPGRPNRLLTQLAERNHGSHRYINTLKLPRK